jgi:hypothetical protein
VEKVTDECGEWMETEQTRETNLSRYDGPAETPTGDLNRESEFNA